jgi:hypothetical protein
MKFVVESETDALAPAAEKIASILNKKSLFRLETKHRRGFAGLTVTL